MFDRKVFPSHMGPSSSCVFFLSRRLTSQGVPNCPVLCSSFQFTVISQSCTSVFLTLSFQLTFNITHKNNNNNNPICFSSSLWHFRWEMRFLFKVLLLPASPLQFVIFFFIQCPCVWLAVCRSGLWKSVSTPEIFHRLVTDRSPPGHRW